MSQYHTEALIVKKAVGILVIATSLVYHKFNSDTLQYFLIVLLRKKGNAGILIE